MQFLNDRSILIVIVAFLYIDIQNNEYAGDQLERVRSWAVSHSIDVKQINSLIDTSGCLTLHQCLNTIITENKRGSTSAKKSASSLYSTTLYKEAVGEYNLIVVKYWFMRHQITGHEIMVERLRESWGVESLLDVWFILKMQKPVHILPIDLSDQIAGDAASWNRQLIHWTFDYLKSMEEDEFLSYYQSLKKEAWDWQGSRDRPPMSKFKCLIWSLVLTIAIQFMSMHLDTLLNPESSRIAATGVKGAFRAAFGMVIAPRKTKVTFHWDGDVNVGTECSFTLEFFLINGWKYPITPDDCLVVEVIESDGQKAPVDIEYLSQGLQTQGTEENVSESFQDESINQVRVTFSPKRSGIAFITVLVGPMLSSIRGSPFRKYFLPGPMDPQQSGIAHHCSTIVSTHRHQYELIVERRDRYGNLCRIPDLFIPEKEYEVQLLEATTMSPTFLDSEEASIYFWRVDYGGNRLALVLTCPKEGIFQGKISYCGQDLKTSEFSLVVLNEIDAGAVQSNISRLSNDTWYPCKCLAINEQTLNHPKDVYLNISSRSIIINEYILGFIPSRKAFFRVRPATRFRFNFDEETNHPYFSIKTNDRDQQHVLIIEDGNQPPVYLVTPDRNIIVATFSYFLLQHIGGNETFQEKMEYFFYEVRKYHQEKNHLTHTLVSLVVQRDKVLESALSTMKRFSIVDWCRKFLVTFEGEPALDQGGVSRELFELLCTKLFDPPIVSDEDDKLSTKESGNNLFMRFKNDRQGLVHPNPRRSPRWKLKHFEFAGRIVGKCLFESAMAADSRYLVKARFTRSFLAQLIGLRLNYRYFEHDDPELWTTKIRYLLENEVANDSLIDLWFVDEEYDDNGKLVATHDLISGGSKIQVTESNKMLYLNALAQHRLGTRVKTEVEHFLRGLNELIPDHLLGIFTEIELELLMCGTGKYSVADLKQNHIIAGRYSDFGSSADFKKVVDWFWLSVSKFNEEEFAKLVQFTTGCSVLPPGGFKNLQPRFTLAPSFNPPGSLPTAHTCFNQLSLPDYASFKEFDRALKLAVNEGTEGFSMA